MVSSSTSMSVVLSNWSPMVVAGVGSRFTDLASHSSFEWSSSLRSTSQMLNDVNFFIAAAGRVTNVDYVNVRSNGSDLDADLYDNRTETDRRERTFTPQSSSARPAANGSRTPRSMLGVARLVGGPKLYLPFCHQTSASLLDARSALRKVFAPLRRGIRVCCSCLRSFSSTSTF